MSVVCVSMLGSITKYILERLLPLLPTLYVCNRTSKKTDPLLIYHSVEV